MTTRLARRKAFHCQHRYGVQGWSDEKNRSTFGLCFTPEGHGHDYELEVYFEGPIDPETGMILNLSDVDRILSEVTEPLNGRHLNFDIAEFAEKVPTTETLARHLFKQILNMMNGRNVELVKLRLYEYEDLWVDVWNA